MVLKSDIDALWDAYEKTKEASKILMTIDKCKTNYKCKHMRAGIKDCLQASRRKMVLLRQRLEQLNTDERKDLLK